MLDEVEIQREYYANTADQYNDMHVREGDEHFFALRFMESIIDFYKIKSILDIGAGTGRVALYLKSKYPNLKIVSLEPVKALREIGYEQGLSEEELVEGDATNLQFTDMEFDLVCEFSALHHIKTPSIAVSEMLRVSRVGIFISDGNNFGQGSYLTRTLKQIINAIGLWKFFDFIKTKGKGYTFTEGDGVAYSYSVFNDYKLISSHCKTIHLLNTKGGGFNLYKTASIVALLGIKQIFQVGEYPSLTITNFSHSLKERIASKNLRRQLTTDETKRLNKLEGIADKLKRGENVQNRQLQTQLSEQEYEQLEYAWREQLELRIELKVKPSDLKRYEERLKQATFNYNRAEG